MRSPANPQRFSLLVVLAVAAISALSGCYTVLKHPRTELVQDGGERRRDCYDCHGGNGPAFAYNPMVAEGFGYYDDFWYPWYAYPWWYRDYWYFDTFDHADDDGGGGIGHTGGDKGDRDTGRRELWGRGPYWTPLPSLPPVVAAPVGGGSGGSGGGTTQPAEQKEGESQRTLKTGDSGGGSSQGSGSSGSGSSQGSGKGNSNDKDKDKDDKKSDRNSWNRGGSKGGKP